MRECSSSTTRIPVYDPILGPEHIVGIVYSKDVARLMHFRTTARTRFDGAPFSELRLNQVMRKPLVVPETKPVLDLLQEFQQKRRHMAIVVDEHGTTVGLVTVEDAIEQLVGEVDDEFDVAAKTLLTSASGALILDGSVNLRDLETQMSWKLPREGGIETLAGFMLTRLGKIPRPKDSVDFEGRRLTVVEMKGNRISKVSIEKIDDSEKDSKRTPLPPLDNVRHGFATKSNSMNPDPSRPDSSRPGETRAAEIKVRE